jgi:hypothetical protein
MLYQHATDRLSWHIVLIPMGVRRMRRIVRILRIITVIRVVRVIKILIGFTNVLHKHAKCRVMLGYVPPHTLLHIEAPGRAGLPHLHHVPV